MLKCLFFLAKSCSTILDPHFKKGFGVHLRWYKAQIGQPKRIQSKKYRNNFLYFTNLSQLTMMPLCVIIDWWNQPSRWKFGFIRRIIVKPRPAREVSLLYKCRCICSASVQFGLIGQTMRMVSTHLQWNTLLHVLAFLEEFRDIFLILSSLSLGNSLGVQLGPWQLVLKNG